MSIEQNLQMGLYGSEAESNEQKIPTENELVKQETESIKSEKEDIEKIKLEIHSQMRKLIERLIENKEQMLGKGQSSEAHYLPDNEDVCFKITTHRDAVGKNLPKPRIPVTIQDPNGLTPHSPKAEGEFLAQLDDTKGPVKVPHPFGWGIWEFTDDGDTYYINEKIEVLAMERIHGPSLREVVDGTKEVPASFEYKRFFSELNLELLSRK